MVVMIGGLNGRHTDVCWRPAEVPDVSLRTSSWLSFADAKSLFKGLSLPLCSNDRC